MMELGFNFIGQIKNKKSKKKVRKSTLYKKISSFLRKKMLGIRPVSETIVVAR